MATPLRRLLVLFMCSTSLIVPPGAQADTAMPPGAPGTPTVFAAGAAGAPASRIVWTAASPGADPVVAYAVERVDPSASVWLQLATTTALELTSDALVPGSTQRVRVVALDANGGRSLPSAETTFVTARVTLAITWRVRDSRGRSRPGCQSIVSACAFTDLRGAAIVGEVTPVAYARSGAAAIERRHRVPGSRIARLRSSRTGVIDQGGAVRVPLASRSWLDTPGAWCYRLVLAPSNTTASASSAWQCPRWRPPVSIGWAGDTTLGSRAYGTPPGDGASVFAGVRRELAAPDLMIGNYEGTLSRGGSPRCSGGALCFVFQAPPRMARGLRTAGFDVMNLANNHGLDMGADARRQTVRALTGNGIAVTGLPNQITIKQVADTRVAVVGFGFNVGMMDLDDLALVRRTVQRAAKRADVVVVVHHSGIEGARGAHVPGGDEDGRGRTRAFTAAAIDAGADVVFGSGPHVLRGIEQRRGRLAFYSTGNFAGWNNFARGGLSSQSGIATVTLEPSGALTAARFIGLRLTGPGRPVPDRSGSVVRHVAALSRADFGRRAPQFGARGSISLR